MTPPPETAVIPAPVSNGSGASKPDELTRQLQEKEARIKAGFDALQKELPFSLPNVKGQFQKNPMPFVLGTAVVGLLIGRLLGGSKSGTDQAWRQKVARLIETGVSTRVAQGMPVEVALSEATEEALSVLGPVGAAPKRGVFSEVILRKLTTAGMGFVIGKLEAYLESQRPDVPKSDPSE